MAVKTNDLERKQKLYQERPWDDWKLKRLKGIAEGIKPSKRLDITLKKVSDKTKLADKAKSKGLRL